jgi:hypothetical protein
MTSDTFSSKVIDTFDPMLAKRGFRLATQNASAVRFENLPMFVEVTHHPGRRELDVWVGDVRSLEPPFELADVLRAAGGSSEAIESVAVMRTDDDSVLSGFLDRGARLLDAHADALLRGDEAALDEARRLRSTRAVEYTRGVQQRSRLNAACLRLESRLSAAEAAWKDGDYGRVHDLLNPVRDSLDQERRRRLAFAEKQLG